MRLIALSSSALIDRFTEYGGEAGTWRLTTFSELGTILHYFDFTATYLKQLSDDGHPDLSAG